MVFKVTKRQKPAFSMWATCMLMKQFTKLQRLVRATKSKTPASEGQHRGCNLSAARVNKVSKLGRAVKDCRKRISDLRLGARRKGAFNKKRGAVQHKDVAKEKVLTWEEEKVTPIVHLVEHGPDASCNSSDSGECALFCQTHHCLPQSCLLTLSMHCNVYISKPSKHTHKWFCSIIDCKLSCNQSSVAI